MSEDYKLICRASTNNLEALQTTVVRMTTPIGKLVRELREARGWNQSELARKVGGGVKPQNIQQLEDGTVKRPRYLVRLARVLGVTAEELEEGKLRRAPAETPPVTPPPGYANVRPVTRSRRSVPLLNLVQAGHPKEVVDDYAPGAGMAELDVDADMAAELGPAAFALQIEGDSMEPEFMEGDRVIIDPDVKPRPGDYVVAKLEREQSATFKRYRSRGLDAAGQEMFELVALNPNYLPIQVNGENPGFIVGTMIEHRRYRRR